MEKEIATRIQYKYDTQANWLACDEVSLEGEIYVHSIDANTVKLTVGDGTTKIKDLPYVALGTTTETAEGSFEFSETEVTFGVNSKDNTKIITIETASDGIISAYSDNTNAVTVEVSDKSIIFTRVELEHETTATVTVTIGEGTNHKAVSKTIEVKVNPTLDSLDWNSISDISTSGRAADYFSVGDTKKITLNGKVGTLELNNYETYVYIIGFNHSEPNSITFGTFKAKKENTDELVDVCLVDINYGETSEDGTLYFSMNHSSWTNAGGWKGSDLRYDILGSTKIKGEDASEDTPKSPVENTLMAALPWELRTVMKPMSIFTDNVAGGADEIANYVTKSIDYLPLLAEYEVFGSQEYANKYEQNNQSQYKYYIGADTDTNWPEKYAHSDLTKEFYWVLRSPAVGEKVQDANVIDANFCSSGGFDCGASTSMGLAPIFTV